MQYLIQKKYILRFLSHIALLCALAWGPWWLSLFGAVTLIVIFKYYEALFAGVLLDATYLNEGNFIFETDFLYTGFLLLCITISLLLSGYLYRV